MHLSFCPQFPSCCHAACWTLKVRSSIYSSIFLMMRLSPSLHNSEYHSVQEAHGPQEVWTVLLGQFQQVATSGIPQERSVRMLCLIYRRAIMSSWTGCPGDIISFIATKQGCGQAFAPVRITVWVFAHYCQANIDTLLNSYKTHVEPFLNLDE